MSRTSLLLAILLALMLTGCAAESPPTDGVGDAGSVASALWNDSDEMLILEVHADAIYEYDVLCTRGGGPHLPREGPGRVLAEAASLRVDVRVDPSFTGLQVGYALTEDPGRGETDQDGIEWLPVVKGGESASLEIPLDSGPFEEPDGPTLWQFYYRMQTPVGTDCYTGGGTGTWDGLVTAVRKGDRSS